MSDALWLNSGKASTAIGTATITAVDDTFTLTGHGLGDGDTVTVDTLTGGASGVLIVDAVYFVRDVTTDTFTVSLSLHGPVVEFASDGGADVYSFAPQYNAAELRRAVTGLMGTGRAPGTGAAFDANFQGREGVLAQRPAAGDVVVSVTGGTWTTDDFAAVVHPGLSSLSGSYLVAVPADSGTYDPADGSNPRVDALDLQVQDDDEDASGFRRARLVYVSGTPAASPTPPAETVNSLRLATWQVNVGGSVTDITHTAPVTVARGGIIPIRSQAELPDALRYQGMAVWDIEREELQVNVSGAGLWAPIARSNGPVAGWTPIAADVTSGGAFDIDVTAGGRFPAGTFSMLRLHGYYQLDDVGSVRLSINNVAGIHTYAFVTIDRLGAVAGNGFADGANQWVISEGATAANNIFDVTIYRTNESSIVSFRGGGMRSPTPGGTAWDTRSWGDVNTSQLVSTLNVRPFSATANDFSGIRFWLEGYRE